MHRGVPASVSSGVRGTRDFYPEDMRVRSWLFGKFHDAAKSHGFEEYDAPVLETEEIYTRKAGDEIVSQLYSFEDKGGRRVSLRPEMTPSLARMVMARSGTLPTPIKWYSIPQCWRYERTQRGRGREHYQWNVDIWGMSDIRADAELLSVMVHLLRSLGLSEEDIVVRVSNRKVLEQVLGDLGIEGDEFTETCVIIDKMDKVPEEKIKEMLKETGIDEEAIRRILSIMGVKELGALASELGEGSPAVQELTSLLTLCDSYGIRGWIELDTSVVRGLSYYTGTVFEAHDRAGELRAICGGGRYDRLIGTLGGKDMPATGFGFGDMVIMELLREKGIVPDLGHDVQDVVFCLDEANRGDAMAIAGRLRQTGRLVDLVLEEKRMKWALRHADRVAAERLVMILPEEWSRGKVKVRDISSGTETEHEPGSL